MAIQIGRFVIGEVSDELKEYYRPVFYTPQFEPSWEANLILLIVVISLSALLWWMTKAYPMHTAV